MKSEAFEFDHGHSALGRVGSHPLVTLLDVTVAASGGRITETG
jgi:hypothetical protein